MKRATTSTTTTASVVIVIHAYLAFPRIACTASTATGTMLTRYNVTTRGTLYSGALTSVGSVVSAGMVGCSPARPMPSDEAIRRASAVVESPDVVNSADALYTRSPVSSRDRPTASIWRDGVRQLTDSRNRTASASSRRSASG